MIEVTVGYVDGVKFITHMKLLQPDDTLNGVPIHEVDSELEKHPQVKESLRILGLHRVGFNYPRSASLYAEGLPRYITAVIVGGLLQVYWFLVRWLYDNARFFKQIPEYQPFSWRYFTPYSWFRGKKK